MSLKRNDPSARASRRVRKSAAARAERNADRNERRARELELVSALERDGLITRKERGEK